MHTTVKRFAFLAAAGIAAMLVMWQPLQSRGTDEDGWKQVRWRFDAKQPLKLEMAERPLAEAAVPAKALQALRRAASDHQLVAFEEEIRDGQSYYEGEWQTGRGTAEATVTADGVLVETEREVSAEKVPRGIREAAESFPRDRKSALRGDVFSIMRLSTSRKGSSVRCCSVLAARRSAPRSQLSRIRLKTISIKGMSGFPEWWRRNHSRGSGRGGSGRGSMHQRGRTSRVSSRLPRSRK